MVDAITYLHAGPAGINDRTTKGAPGLLEYYDSTVIQSKGHVRVTTPYNAGKTVATYAQVPSKLTTSTVKRTSSDLHPDYTRD